MIISADLQNALDLALPILKKLQIAVDNLTSSIASNLGGHCETSRIKLPESIAAKIEKESIKFLFTDMEDLVATTVVLSSRQQIEKFEERIQEFCEIVDKKSERVSRPEQFEYDDRHLILRLRESHNAVIELPALRHIKFEVQLKTHLQNALSKWSRPTYKTSKLSWSLARLISQTRALVEMADEALARIESGIGNDETIEYELYSRQNKLIQLLKTKLQPEQLPGDLRRLAVTVEQDLSVYKGSSLLDRLQILEELLSKESNKDILSASSLSAYNVVLIALVRDGKATKTSQNGSLALVGRRTLLVTRDLLTYCQDLANLDPAYKVDLSVPE